MSIRIRRCIGSYKEYQQPPQASWQSSAIPMPNLHYCRQHHPSKRWNGRTNYDKNKNLGFEERKVNEELNKCHHLGKAKDGKQSTIIRFKFQASVYASRSNIQNTKKLKLQISSTKCRTKIINYAHTITEPVPQVKFAYADVNGNLKICPHKRRQGKYMFLFNSIDSLHDIFRKFGWPLPNNDVSDDEDV